MVNYFSYDELHKRSLVAKVYFKLEFCQQTGCQLGVSRSLQLSRRSAHLISPVIIVYYCHRTVFLDYHGKK
jgi:hypothetical protein